MPKRTLQRMGYTIKHTAVGWWVDGASGYKVGDGYATTEAEAIEVASDAIKAAKAGGRSPVWLFQ